MRAEKESRDENGAVSESNNGSWATAKCQWNSSVHLFQLHKWIQSKRTCSPPRQYQIVRYSHFMQFKCKKNLVYRHENVSPGVLLLILHRLNFIPIFSSFFLQFTSVRLFLRNACFFRHFFPCHTSGYSLSRIFFPLIDNGTWNTRCVQNVRLKRRCA